MISCKPRDRTSFISRRNWDQFLAEPWELKPLFFLGNIFKIARFECPGGGLRQLSTESNDLGIGYRANKIQGTYVRIFIYNYFNRGRPVDLLAENNGLLKTISIQDMGRIQEGKKRMARTAIRTRDLLDSIISTQTRNNSHYTIRAPYINLYKN